MFKRRLSNITINQEETGMAKPSINIGHIKITDHLVLGITEDKIAKGVESFNHLTLESTSFVGWNALGSALQDGKIDAALMLAPYAMELFHSKVPIKMVLLGHKSGSIIIKNSRANIDKIEDFKGKTVLIPHNLSVHNMIFDKMLRDAGLTVGVEGDVRFEVYAPSQIPEAMEWDEKGSIGGFIVAEPFGSQVIKAGYGEEFALSKDIWPEHPCCILMVNDDIVGKHPDAVQELTNSLVASGNFISENIDSASEIGGKFLKQETDVIKKVLSDTGRVTFNELMPKLDDFEKMQTYLTTKINAMSEKIDLEKFSNLEFAKESGAK